MSAKAFKALDRYTYGWLLVYLYGALKALADIGY
jgi:hypothetical protein